MAKKPAKKAPTKRKVTAAKKPRKPTQKKEERGKCFVMMPFSDPFDVYYEHLYLPAIKEAGLDPVRADDLFRPSVIASDLWKMIQEAKVLLAELTTKNANVFYELGLAHAIGKPVILVSETMMDVPFDLQQLRVLMYDKDDPAWGEKLAADITAAIREILADPVEAVPDIFRKKVKSQGPEQDVLESRLESLETEMRRLKTGPSRGRGRPTTTSDSSRFASVLLRNVRSSKEFDEWVHRWNRSGLSIQQLTSIVLDNSDKIHPTEAERIPEILLADG